MRAQFLIRIKLEMTIVQSTFIRPIAYGFKRLWKGILLIIFSTLLFVSFKSVAKTTESAVPVQVTEITHIIDRPPAKTRYPNIAVLVEFRSAHQIIAIVFNINQHLPSTWPVLIFHGKENENFIRNSTLASLIASGKVILSRMEVVYNRSRTNELFTTPAFWKRIPAEKILLFQIDTVMCSNSRHKITDYLQYDYIGAPWDFPWFEYDRKYNVGNGGFSLRSRNKTLELLALIPYNKVMPEDVWYAQNMHRVNASIAPAEIAKTFSVESVYYERPVGVHRFPWSCEFRAKLAETCPEATLTMEKKSC